MDRREAREALRFAEQWGKEGLLSGDGLSKIRERYGLAAKSADSESFGTTILYSLGGILLGAAVIAFLFLLEDSGFIDDAEAAAPWMFLGWGVLMASAAYGIDYGLKRPDLADAFHVAALVAVTASAFPRSDEVPLWAVAMAFGLWTAWYRRRRSTAPLLGLVAFNLAVPPFVFEGLRDRTDEVGITVWLAIAVVQLAVLAFLGKKARMPWTTAAAGLATLLLAATFLGYYFEVGDDHVRGFPGDAEVFVALVMGAAMGAGLYLREKGMVLAAAGVLAVDAIIFAFDVGDLVGGLLSILAVAALLIWQAGALRQFLQDD